MNVCVDTPASRFVSGFYQAATSTVDVVTGSPLTKAATLAYFKGTESTPHAFDAKPKEPAVVTNWADASSEEIQQAAFAHHQQILKDEMDRIDRQFAKETAYLTQVTDPGKPYPLATHSQYLPKVIFDQIAPLMQLNPNIMNELAFTWAWSEGDRPQIYIFAPKSPDGSEAAVGYDEGTGEVFIIQSKGNKNPHGLYGNAGTSNEPLDTLLSGGIDLNSSLPFSPPKFGNAKPEAVVFVDKKNPKPTDALLSGDDTLAAGGIGMLLLGSMAPGGTGGGGPGGMRPALPVKGMLIQGGIGTGVFLGIHYGVLAVGIPERIAPYADVTAMMGGFHLLDRGSAFLASKGFLSNRLFPGGINWGGFAHASPFLIWGSVGSSYLMDAAGYEFGSAGNLIGTVGLTTTGYVGLSQTTSLLSQASSPSLQFAARHPHVVAFAEHFPKTTAAFSNLGTAYATTRGVGLVPQSLNIGSKSLLLGTAGAGGTSGIYLASGGWAGGAGYLAGGLQAIGAAGVVALGSWIGGGIVDIWAHASGYADDGDYKLIEFTWNHMNVEVAGSFLNAVFGPLIRGIQALTIPDEVYEGMELNWKTWIYSCNNWANSIDQIMISFALVSMTLESSGSEGPHISFNYEIFRKGLEQYLQSKTVSKGCKDSDDGGKCKSNSEVTTAVMGMYKMLMESSQKYNMSNNMIDLAQLISRNGSVSFEPGTRDYVAGLLEKLQDKGILKFSVQKALKIARNQLNAKMVDVGLMTEEYPDGCTALDYATGDKACMKVKYVPAKLVPGKFTKEQIKFLFGDRNTYRLLASKQITDATQIKSESVVLKSRIEALELLLKKIEGGDTEIIGKITKSTF